MPIVRGREGEGEKALEGAYKKEMVHTFYNQARLSTASGGMKEGAVMPVGRVRTSVQSRSIELRIVT